ncbi:MAG: M23 family metallopeptidase [Betaproteobacteria bacterium]|nr:MAG: M23 family metallopeptidase [Betaproteobacteria bacterium]
MRLGEIRTGNTRSGKLACLALLAATVALGALSTTVQAALPGAVRGGAAPLPTDEITPAERARIDTAIARNVDALLQAGRLTAFTPKLAPKSAPLVPLQWPLRLVPGHPEKGARTITNFVDNDPAYPNQLRDYNCGARTYDQANGYNHQGTDITAYPFAWRKMDNEEAIVVAAAPGIIVMKEDGQFDRSCALNMQPWNAVYLRHADGSMTWYGHLKASSLTSKGTGEWVQTGEFLGVMGSSGDSTGPHLHFEVHASDGSLIDPFGGACNGFNTESWWAQQRPYNEPAIDLIMTGDAPVEFNACPTPEIEHRNAYFQPGQTVYLTAFLTDQQRANASVFNVYTPNGTLFDTTTISSDVDYYAASYWQWSLSARHRPAAPRQCRRVLRRLARSLLHDGVHRRGGEARRRHAHRRMDAHRRVISGVLRERCRTVDGLPLFRHSGARRQLALLHRIRFRMRCRQAARRLDLRGECVLHRRGRRAMPSFDATRVPALQQRHGRRPQSPLYDALAGDQRHASRRLGARGRGVLRAALGSPRRDATSTPAVKSSIMAAPCSHVRRREHRRSAPGVPTRLSHRSRRRSGSIATVSALVARSGPSRAARADRDDLGNGRRGRNAGRAHRAAQRRR